MGLYPTSRGGVPARDGLIPARGCGGVFSGDCVGFSEYMGQFSRCEFTINTSPGVSCGDCQSGTFTGTNKIIYSANAIGFRSSSSISFCNLSFGPLEFQITCLGSNIQYGVFKSNPPLSFYRVNVSLNDISSYGELTSGVLDTSGGTSEFACNINNGSYTMS